MKACKRCKNIKDFSFYHKDHSTGLVRGLLCNRHNNALGLLDDSIEIVNNIITYLKETKHVQV